MRNLQDELTTIQPDLINVTRLFAIPDTVWDAPQRYSFQEWEEEGAYHCVFTDGASDAERSVPVPVRAECEDERTHDLHCRRAARRLCRQTLYDLCRNTTGIHPPWGSLTGVRPTRLIYEQLEAGIPLDKAAGRLTALFDVTRDKAELLREVVETQSALPAVSDRWMDVYIGIPFCTTRCAYCSFSSGEVGDGRLLQPYVEALLKEMAACSRLLRDSGHSLRALYIGGGTPTSLSAALLAKLLESVRLLFPGAYEYTVEAGRPDTITEEKLRVIREAGVSRISINPQTMNDHTLAVIGRAHTARDVEMAYALARNEGFHHINMDVIAGLPGEELTDFERTMDAARRLRPESLTVHNLAIKRSSRMNLEKAPLPPPATAAAMTALGRETAAQLGMRAYYLYRQKHIAGNQENVGYALPGHACLYNVDIMEEQTHILAMGAGAISKRIYPEEGHIGREPNVSNIEQYIARVDEMIQRKEKLWMDQSQTAEQL